MRKINCLFIFCTVLLQQACSPTGRRFDAEGVFEADEVIVSSEVGGKLLSLTPEEGAQLAKDSLVAIIDSVPLHLQKMQVQATIGSLQEKTMDVRPQIELLHRQITAQKIQLADMLREKARTERLIHENAAPAKQLDDYTTQVDLLRQQIAASEQQILVQQTTTGTQNNTVMSEVNPLTRSVAQIDDQLKRTLVLNPIAGTVLTKYAMAGEITSPGKALYKIADLSVITLRAYVTGTQLAQLKLGQAVRVFADDGPVRYREYPATIISIADKSEFTPKTIQTKDERADLVYAIRLHVKNDGYLKIGMFGEVNFGK